MKQRLAGIAAAPVIVVAVGGTLGYRKAYGTWWQAPQRIDYCERTYLRGAPGPSRADIDQHESLAGLSGDAPYPVVAVPPVVGRPLLAIVSPEAERRRLGLPCSMALYLDTGADTYTAYGLSGGP
jgi:hypothetical protein